MQWKNRTYCGDVSGKQAGAAVVLMGWVDAIRDHGNLLFIHLRDIRGIVQVVFNPQTGADLYLEATRLKEEYVVEIEGVVHLREPGTENPNLATGRVEVFASRLRLFARSRTLPFQISEKAMVFGEELKSSPESVDEELRLQYRYLDLRRPTVQARFVKRYQIIRSIRDFLDERGFVEIETPFLTRSTPEGARDFLVPSRTHQGKFYALPQSPQLFKQLLMVGGMDRYFQIARCFRDEDLRPNRQPEFTQLDLEASFIDEEFIYEMLEELTCRIFAVGGIDLPRPFPRMTYAEAMSRYGSDRPDLRFDMAFEDLTDLFEGTGYAIFRRIRDEGGLIKGFCVKGAADLLSKNILQNEYALKLVPAFGGKGMTWMKVAGGRLESNIVQFFSPEEQAGLVARFQAGEGDVLMLIADTDRDLAHKVLASLRLHVAQRLDRIPQDRFRPLWVTDFPLFEWKEGRLSSQHHPFTMPDRTEFDPRDVEGCLQLNSRAYDLVMNGEELGGGSIRIHDMAVQRKIFEALELSPEEAEGKFGFFLNALEFGAPPHAGLALGLDRVIAMILKEPNIREIIAFPKNRSAFCPLTRAPAGVDPLQLEELGIGLTGAGGDTKDSTAARPSKAAVRSERISAAEVRHVARLARLRIDDTEVRAFQKDLNAVLEHFEALQELDTRDVEPMSHVLDLKNVWREDVPREGKEIEPLLQNAPMREADYFKVPKILEG
ncbi:aspartate--tRNA ligase [Desulfatiglans anilini]|uniref:aspartate--tRNA ligase n=1 Tax=Desulfatiglans anilini TaxID=90728 RepID=UPI000555A6CF|nr:aspartate--tRNA ligase [Desulfatiglans anilini]